MLFQVWFSSSFLRASQILNTYCLRRLLPYKCLVLWLHGALPSPVRLLIDRLLSSAPHQDFGVWNISYEVIPCLPNNWAGIQNQAALGSVADVGDGACCPADPVVRFPSSGSRNVSWLLTISRDGRHTQTQHVPQSAPRPSRVTQGRLRARSPLSALVAGPLGLDTLAALCIPFLLFLHLCIMEGFALILDVIYVSVSCTILQSYRCIPNEPLV